MDMEEGYIKKLTKEEATAPAMHKWYLPHHPVLQPKKPEWIRRVCDATAKFQGSSLNSQLVSGLDLLNNLVGIFMSLSVDIEAKFHQVAIPEEDQASLWCQSPELVEMLNKTAFHLTKWISNEEEVIMQIPESERAPSIKVVQESIVTPMVSFGIPAHIVLSTKW